MELLAKKINIAFIVATLLFTSVAVFGVVGSVEGAMCGEAHYDNSLPDNIIICSEGDTNKVSCNTVEGIQYALQGSGTESDPYTCCNPKTQLCNPVDAASLDELLNNILRYLIFLTGILTVTAIIIGSILYIMSGAKSTLVSKARNVIQYALLGFVLALLARGIVSLINILF